jgi:hypothetical protein
MFFIETYEYVFNLDADTNWNWEMLKIPQTIYTI